MGPFASRREVQEMIDRALAAHLAAAHAPAPPPPPPPPPGPPEPPVEPPVEPPTNPLVVDITTLGVKANVHLDQTAAIQRAIDGHPGLTLLFPPGSYEHAGVIKAHGAVTLTGPGATLVGTDPATMAVWLDDTSCLSDITLLGTGTQRRAEWEACGVVVWGSGNAVDNVRITRSSAAGIQLEGASNFVVRRCVLADTLSDSVHITGESHDGLVELCEATRSGDDSFAVVAYDGQGPVERIVIRSNRSVSSKARGVTVAGGVDITVERNEIERSAAAGINVASEPSYRTMPSSRVTVTNNKLTGCNTNAAIVHGGIFVWGGQQDRPITSVAVVGNVVADTVVGPAHLRAEGRVTGLSFVGNVTSGSKPHAQISLPAGAWTRQGDLNNGSPVPNV